MEGNNPFADLIPQTGAKPAVTYGPPPTPKTTEPDTPKLGVGYRWKDAAHTIQEPIPGGPADKTGPDADPTGKSQESERTAAFLTTNLLSNINIMNDAIKADPSAAAPTLKQAAAGIFGETARNYATPAQRQVAYNAQRLIVDAALTLGTGAAYTPVQIDAYTRGFFPQVGDSPEAIAGKRKSLQAALLAARTKAGSQAPKIDEAMRALGMDPEGGYDAEGAPPAGAQPPSPAGTPPKEAKPQTVESLYEGGPQSDAGMGELDAKQKQAYAAFWKANPSPSPAALSTFLSGIGVPNVREADAANIIKGVKSGLGYSTAIDRTSAARAEIVRQNALRSGGSGFREGVETDAETLAKSGQSLGLSDEAAGIGRGLSKAVQGENPFTGYVLGRDAERLRIEDARRQLGWTGTAIEVGGGLLSANPGALSAINLTGRQLAAQGARGGLAGGALAGWGGGEGTQGSVTGALVGGAGGALVGGALGGLSGRLGRQAARPDVARAAADEGIDLPAMMVTGSRRDINRAGALESGGGEAPVVIQEGFGDVANAVEGRTAALGGGGTGRSEEAIGESVQRAGRRFIQRSKGVADRLYNRARSLAGDARIVPTDAIRQVDEELASLQGNPGVNRAEISFLETLKNDLSTPGGKTVEELRGLRTSLRGSISNADLTATQAEARALRVMDAVHNDARANLPRGAADAFRRADMYYRERMVHIDDVLDRFIGGERGVAKLSGEQAFRKVKSMADSDGRRLAAIMRDLTGPERQDVAATIAQSLGRTADDAPFTVDQFIRQTNKFSPSARRTIFGPDGAQSIENLRVLSRRLQEIQGQVNRSRTANPIGRTLRQQAGNIITGLLTGGGALTAGGGGAMTGAATGVAINSIMQATGAVRRQLSARALMSPRVTNWLLRASNVNTPRQAQEVVRSLGTVIAREPALANELTPIQRYLSGVVSTPAAASDAEQGGADNEQR